MASEARRVPGHASAPVQQAAAHRLDACPRGARAHRSCRCTPRAQGAGCFERSRRRRCEPSCSAHHLSEPLCLVSHSERCPEQRAPRGVRRGEQAGLAPVDVDCGPVAAQVPGPEGAVVRPGVQHILLLCQTVSDLADSQLHARGGAAVRCISVQSTHTHLVPIERAGPGLQVVRLPCPPHLPAALPGLLRTAGGVVSGHGQRNARTGKRRAAGQAWERESTSSTARSPAEVLAAIPGRPASRTSKESTMALAAIVTAACLSTPAPLPAASATGCTVPSDSASASAGRSVPYSHLMSKMPAAPKTPGWFCWSALTLQTSGSRCLTHHLRSPASPRRRPRSRADQGCQALAPGAKLCRGRAGHCAAASAHRAGMCPQPAGSGSLGRDRTLRSLHATPPLAVRADEPEAPA